MTPLDALAHAPKRRRLALPRLTPRSQRKLVIRGDLRSATGYGHETRALANLLRARFEVLGVDLHPNPSDNSFRFPGRLVDDAEIAAMCARGEQPFVLNNTPPESFAYFSNATNIGAFYWETDALPLQKGWLEKICAMDYMWAKTNFDRGLIQQSGYARAVQIVTWPFDFDSSTPARPQLLDDLEALVIDRMPHDGCGERWPLQRIRHDATNLFLSVKSLAPRKGLPILLTEWREYITHSVSDDILLLKLRFIHNSTLSGDPDVYIKDMLARAGFKPGARVRIAFTTQDLTTPQLQELYRLSEAYVTASYGEGFGGPLIESLLLHRPVIASRHTAALDLLDEANPLIFASRRLHVGLRGNPSIYPNASSWHLPQRGALAKALERFSALDTEARIETTRHARAHAAAFCSKATVEQQINTFFNTIDRT